MELARGFGLDIEVGLLPVSSLRRAEEIFLSSTAGGVLPVTCLDGQMIAGPGPLTLRLKQAYWDLHRDPTYVTEVLR